MATRAKLRFEPMKLTGFRAVFLPVELQCEFRSARIGLDVGDAPKLAASLMDQIGSTAGRRRQTEIGIRKSQVLVIQRVEGLPTKVKVCFFDNVKLLA